jgi:hypothetical protein
MAKLSLKANPTFMAKVGIPVAGGAPVDVEFTFKHRDREQLDKYLAELKAMGTDSIDNDVAIVLKVATAWELDEPFNEANVRIFIENYHKAPWVIAQAYITELMQAKAGN